MALYKKIKRVFVQNGKEVERWYLQSVSQGKAVSTKELCERIAAESTVSRADVFAVMMALPDVMRLYLNQGRNVHIENVGHFSYKIINGQGAPTREEATVDQIDTVRVQFTQEVTYSKQAGRRVAKRSLIDSNLFWEEFDKPSTRKKSDDSNESETGTGGSSSGSGSGTGTGSGSGSGSGNNDNGFS